MTDQNNPISRELKEAEALEAELTRLFASLEPPFGAAQRLQSELETRGFDESHLTLDNAGPYLFVHLDEQADDSMPDVLAAGLEEQPIEDDEPDTA